MLQGFIFLTHLDRALGSRPDLLPPGLKDGGEDGEAEQADEDTHVVSCECVSLLQRLLTCEFLGRIGTSAKVAAEPKSLLEPEPEP